MQCHGDVLLDSIPSNPKPFKLFFSVSYWSTEVIHQHVGINGLQQEMTNSIVLP